MDSLYPLWETVISFQRSIAWCLKALPFSPTSQQSNKEQVPSRYHSGLAGLSYSSTLKRLPAPQGTHIPSLRPGFLFCPSVSRPWLISSPASSCLSFQTQIKAAASLSELLLLFSVLGQCLRLRLSAVVKWLVICKQRVGVFASRQLGPGSCRQASEEGLWAISCLTCCCAPHRDDQGGTKEAQAHA